MFQKRALHSLQHKPLLLLQAKALIVLLVTFTFTKEERASINSVQKVIMIQGTGKLWLQNNLPTKGEIEITRTTSYEGLEESTTTSNARIEFEIAYTYQPPEWVAEVTG